MLDKQRIEFKKYFEKFDVTDQNIFRKYTHSLRVMEFATNIAKSLNLPDHITNIIGIAGMLHDIGRFKQWTDYKTFCDLESVDHGKLGYDILIENDYINNYIEDASYKAIILKAVLEHNKFKISDNLDLNEEIICKIIRDADKLDIMETQVNEINSEEKFDKEYLTYIYSEKCIEKIINSNDIDHAFRQLCFIYDLNFQYSFKYLLDKGIIEKKLSNIEKFCPKDVDFNEIKNIVLTYIKKRIDQ